MPCSTNLSKAWSRAASPHRILTSRYAVARSKVYLGQNLTPGDIHKADGIVLVISHYEPLAVCGHCQAHRTWSDIPESQSCGMVQLHRNAALGPAASIPVVEMNVVIRPATDVKLFPSRIKREPVKSVRHLKNLCLQRLSAGNIKDKDVFVGSIGIGVSKIRTRREILAVVAASKNEQRVSVGTDCCGYRLSDGKSRIKRKSRIQRLERRPGSSRWSDVHARRNESSFLKDEVIRLSGNHSSNADKAQDRQRKCRHNHPRLAGSAIPQHVLPPVYSAVLGSQSSGPPTTALFRPFGLS